MNEHLSPTELATLLEVAERAVREMVLHHRRLTPDPDRYPPSLREPGAAFVTLHRHGKLAGCLGVLASSDPLVVTVAHRACAAAVGDPRFRPVEPDDLPYLDVEVSVLSPAEPIAVHSYASLLAAVHPGVDGVTVESGRHRATLLPSVWHDLPDPEHFVAALWRKAGLHAGEWPSNLTVWRYRTQVAGRAGAGV